VKILNIDECEGGMLHDQQQQRSWNFLWLLCVSPTCPSRFNINFFATSNDNLDRMYLMGQLQETDADS
jgi:hypothetical protein